MKALWKTEGQLKFPSVNRPFDKVGGFTLHHQNIEVDGGKSRTINLLYYCVTPHFEGHKNTK